MRVDGRVVVLSEHACERYRERVRDVLDVEGEITRLAAVVGEIRFEEPPWRGLSKLQPSAWLMLGDDVAFALQGQTAVTCIARGGMSDTARAGRNGHNARVRSGKRVRRQVEGPRATAKPRRLER